MNNFLTRKNIGLFLTGALCAFLAFSASGKLLGNQEVKDLLGSNGLTDWIMIIGIGELISVILFAIPKTMRLGTLLLSAYFGGAIMFHMTHSDPVHQPFVGPAVFLILVWVIAWVRGMKVVEV